MTNFIDAWNTTTGEKLPNQVPDTWPSVFDHISATQPTPATAPTKEEDI